jgi:hypothetical protein
LAPQHNCQQKDIENIKKNYYEEKEMREVHMNTLSGHGM